MNERDSELRETDREYLTRAFPESFQQDIDLASVSLNRGNRWKFVGKKHAFEESGSKMNTLRMKLNSIKRIDKTILILFDYFYLSYIKRRSLSYTFETNYITIIRRKDKESSER